MYAPSFVEIRGGSSIFCDHLAWNYPNVFVTLTYCTVKCSLKPAEAMQITYLKGSYLK